MLYMTKMYTYAYLLPCDVIDTDSQVVLNSWYANVVATDPVRQGKGYGSMLVRAGMQQVSIPPVINSNYP